MTLRRPYTSLLVLITLFAALQLGCGDGDAPLEVGTKDNNTTSTDQGSDKGGEQTAHVTTCSDVSSSSGEMKNQYDKRQIQVEGSDKTYVLHTNWWNDEYYKTDPAGLPVAYNGLTFTVSNPNGIAVPPTVGAPIGYPSFYIGSYGGMSSTGSNLPKKVSDIQSVPTALHTNASEVGYANKNASYDVWFTAGGDPLPSNQYSPGTGGAYLMVWLFMPSDRQPRGGNAAPQHTVEGVDGQWDVWIDYTNPPCISYVPVQPIDGLDFDLNDFIRDSVENAYGITDDMYLSIVFGGFEIWGGADGYKIEEFCASVN